MGAQSKDEKMKGKKDEAKSKSVDEYLQMIYRTAQKQGKGEQAPEEISSSSSGGSSPRDDLDDEEEFELPKPEPTKVLAKAGESRKKPVTSSEKKEKEAAQILATVKAGRQQWMDHAKALEEKNDAQKKEAEEVSTQMTAKLEKAKRKYRKYQGRADTLNAEVVSIRDERDTNVQKARKAEQEKEEALTKLNTAKNVSDIHEKLTVATIQHLKNTGQEDVWQEILKVADSADKKDLKKDTEKVAVEGKKDLDTGRVPPEFPTGVRDQSGRPVATALNPNPQAGEKRKRVSLDEEDDMDGLPVKRKKDGSIDGRSRRARKLRVRPELGAASTPAVTPKDDLDKMDDAISPEPALPTIAEEEVDSMSESTENDPMQLTQPSMEEQEQTMENEIGNLQTATANAESLRQGLEIQEKLLEVNRKEIEIVEKLASEAEKDKDDISEDSDEIPAPASSSHEAPKVCTNSNFKSQLNIFFSKSSLYYKTNHDTATARFRRLSIWPEVRDEFKVDNGWELKGVNAGEIISRLNLSCDKFPRVTKDGGFRLKFDEFRKAIEDTLKLARNEQLGKILEIEKDRAPTAINLNRCLPENAPDLIRSAKQCKNRQLWTSFLDKAKPDPVPEKLKGKAKGLYVAERNRQVAATLELVASEIGTHSKMVQRYLGIDKPVAAATVSQKTLGRAMTAIKRSMMVVKKGITADSARQRANTLLRFKAWHNTFVKDRDASWLHPKPLDVKDYLDERRNDGETCPSSDWEHLKWFAKNCGYDLPSSKQIENFEATIAKQNKKILSEDEIDDLIEQGKWHPKRCSWTPRDIVKLEEKAEKGCEISSFTLVMVWSTIRPSHIQLSTVEDIDFKNRVIKFHCAAGKQHGPLNAFKFQCTLQSISKEPREWWTPFVKAMEKRNCREDDFLFMRKDGMPMNTNEMTDAIRNVCKDWLSEYEVMQRTARSSRYFVTSTAGSCAVGEEHTVTAGFWKDHRDIGNQSRSMPSAYDDNRVVKNEFLRTMLAQLLTEYNVKYDDDFKEWDATAMMRFMGARMAIMKGQDPGLVERFWGA